MGQLRNDHFARGGLDRRPRGSFTLRLPILIFLSLTLIALSRLDHPWVRELRAEAEAVLAPALAAVLVPFDPARRLVDHIQSSYEGFADRQRLIDENQRLRQWQDRATALERKLGEMADLNRTLEQQKLDYRTVRVIATSVGGFVHSALLEAGTDQGITTGLPVISADGVIGRIVEAGRRTSRVLLLTDINSRIPVAVGPGQVRAILAGDNGATARLTMLPQEAPIAAGEDILTSGLGGIFPRGMRIGSVVMMRDGPRATLAATLGQLEYVSVLMYDNPGLMLARELRQGPADTTTTAGATQQRQRSARDRGGLP